MTSQSLRTSVPDPREPSAHALEPIRGPGPQVAVALIVRVAEEGGWRARLRFTELSDAGDLREERLTAEIFCGATEDDLWQSVRSLGEHHVRDLYRSLG
jgi:hypothetical protein